MMRAFVFPGQGSQTVGMGKPLADTFVEAREIFQEVDEALSQNLSRLMFEGPESDLSLTENTQPALLAMSMAVVRILQKQGNVDFSKTAKFMAGHSLGEYAALTAAGTLTVTNAAKLLKMRGKFMQQAVPPGIGSMAAIIGLKWEDVVEITKQAAGNQICVAANYNSADQIVISGHKEAIERAAELAKEKGAKRAIILKVSGPFHSPLIQSAANAMEKVLAETSFAKPVIPIIANVTASPESDPEKIKSLLVQQITGTVRWHESVLYMKEHGVTEIIELGAGKVLSNMARRYEGITAASAETPAEIEALILQLK